VVVALRQIFLQLIELNRQVVEVGGRYIQHRQCSLQCRIQRRDPSFSPESHRD
jgi:hypothetical protein